MIKSEICSRSKEEVLADNPRYNTLLLMGYALLRDCLDYKAEEQDMRRWPIQVWQLGLVGLAIADFNRLKDEMATWIMDAGTL